MSDPTLVILDLFEQINAIPRCSSNEAALCRWLVSWADHRNLDHNCDKDGNLRVWLPASKGYESAPIIVLQAHMDMVCEKTPDSSHNFDKDPIVSHREGEWLTATDTTLGADNGIAIAYMLALAEDAGLDHPPIELLFTVDEERGLAGAKKLNPDFIKGRVLINLDSEDEGIFTIGCAGGIDTTITLHCEKERVSSDPNCFHRLVVGGLKGGHSGIDIHKLRGNANRILARTLDQIKNAVPIKLIALQGGTRTNAIPRDAEALIWFEAIQGDDLVQTIAHIEQTLKKEYAVSDNALFVKLEKVSDIKSDEKALTQKATDHIIQILLALPNGVSHMSPEMEGMVETSNNLATVSLADGKLTILSSQRSSSISRLDAITAAVTSVAKLAGATTQNHDAYPPWQPMMDSLLLRRSKETYQQLYDRKPVIQVIHAGLECAVIGDLYPGMDMISFGPTIRNPHSPDERIWIPSIKKVWDFLVTLLKRYCPDSPK
jgi:dipeptidase D